MIPDSDTFRVGRPFPFRGMIVVVALAAWIVAAALLGVSALDWLRK